MKITNDLENVPNHYLQTVSNLVKMIPDHQKIIAVSVKFADLHLKIVDKRVKVVSPVTE